MDRRGCSPVWPDDAEDLDRPRELEIRSFGREQHPYEDSSAAPVRRQWSGRVGEGQNAAPVALVGKQARGRPSTLPDHVPVPVRMDELSLGVDGIRLDDDISACAE